MKLSQVVLNALSTLVIVLAITPVLTLVAGPTAHVAADCPSDSTSKGQVLQGLGQTGSDCSDTQVNNTLKTAIEVMSIVVGVAAVIVIIVSGFKYITSGGEQNKVANAKNSLIYALVGVAVAALAQFMIHFVLFNTNQ